MSLIGNVHLVSGDGGMISPILEMLRTEGVTPEGNPDVYVREYASFGVEEAREITMRASSKAIGSGRRVFIVVAPGMTSEAQNALLKTLEEPSGDALFFIVTVSPQSLLPTLRSRAQMLSLQANSFEGPVDARAFLAATPAKRLDMLKPLLEKADDERRDMGAIVGFLGLLEKLLAADSRKNAAGIKAVYLARMYILDKGALAKPLLEEVALLS